MKHRSTNTPQTTITVRLADWDTDGELIRAVRRVVFVVEQNVPEELDFDGSDVGCRHILALEGNTPVATARLGPDGRVGRMAVLESHRRRGIGTLLMTSLIDLARQENLQELQLHSQVHANAFYENFGFVPEGDEFIEADIPHVLMTRKVTIK